MAIALQLVKPTVFFLNLWLQLDSDGLTEMVLRPVSTLTDSCLSPICDTNNTIASPKLMCSELWALSLDCRKSSIRRTVHGIIHCLRFTVL